jgi:hypothetical protein
MEKTKFLFSEASAAYWQKLNQEQQEAVVQNYEGTEEQLQVHDADHVANREQRVANVQKALTQHYEAEFNLPRPKAVPAPRLKTDAELHAEAQYRVQRAYTEKRQAIIQDGRQRERDYIKAALDIDPPDRSPEGPSRKTDRDY